MNIEGVTAANFVEALKNAIKDAIIAALSSAGLTRSKIKLSLLSASTRRNLAPGSIQADIDADDDNAATQLATQLDNVDDNDLKNDMNDRIVNAGINGISVTSLE